MPSELAETFSYNIDAGLPGFSSPKTGAGHGDDGLKGPALGCDGFSHIEAAPDVRERPGQFNTPARLPRGIVGDKHNRPQREISRRTGPLAIRRDGVAELLQRSTGASNLLDRLRTL